jgi:predicted Zn-dependent protease with MMP-like domain
MAGARLTFAEFCRIVRQVLEELPEPFKPYLENVVVDVENAPSRSLLRKLGMTEAHAPLLGLFEGPPPGEREYGISPPVRIRIFKRPIERLCRNRQEVEYEIRRTVLHELAHHFGFEEEDLEPFESHPSPFDDHPEGGHPAH